MIMSFISEVDQGKVYAPGWFLVDNEDCTRLTKEISQTGATTAANGAKYVKMGTVWPSNDENAVGIVYEDVDVTTGDMPGSVVTSGTVYEDRLPVAVANAAKTALQGKGFKFVATSPAVTRPNWTN